MSSERGEVDRAAAVFRYELAAFALRRIAADHSVEVKFRKDQARVSAGNGRESGRFADEGRGTSRRATSASGEVTRNVARRAGLAALANPELTGAAAASAALPAAAAYVGVSRSAGLAEHYLSGRPITPFLHIPYDLPGGVTHMTRRSSPKSSTAPKRGYAEAKRRDEDCDDLYDDDRRRCKAYGRLYGSNKPGAYTAKTIRAICYADAAIRLSQCRRGGLSAVSKELFTGGEK